MDISRTGKGSPVWEHVIPTKYPQRGILHRRTTGFVKQNVTLTSHGTSNIAWKQLECLYIM